MLIFLESDYGLFFDKRFIRFNSEIDSIFILLISIPLVTVLEKYKLSWPSFKKKAIIFILITTIIFIGRNLARLNKEFKVYNYNIFENNNYKFIGGDKDFYFRYNKILNEKKFDHYYINFLGKKILVIKN